MPCAPPVTIATFVMRSPLNFFMRMNFALRIVFMRYLWIDESIGCAAPSLEPHLHYITRCSARHRTRLLPGTNAAASAHVTAAFPQASGEKQAHSLERNMLTRPLVSRL